MSIQAQQTQPKQAVNPLLQLMAQLPKMHASDLHISVGMPAVMRINGAIKQLKTPIFEARHTEKMILDILTEKQRQEFEEKWNIDFCYDLPNVGRFRGNVLKQRKGIDAVFRYIPENIPTAETLGLNDTILKLANKHQGLVLVTGATRSGKSTTLAALIQSINLAERKHVITVEDPIEYIFPRGQSLINQREVARHTKSPASAIRAALREDPDIVVVGEMRDLETIQLAISAAETGHLVISTMQTQGAHKTVDRIVDSFPPSNAGQIRAMLSKSLQGVVAQQLLKRADGSGMVLATEILLSTNSLTNMIRDGKTFQIPSILQTGSAVGMKKMETAIFELLQKGLVTEEEALRSAYEPKALEKLIAEKKRG